MKLVKPVTITDSILTSTTIPENDYAEWNSGTSYVAGNKVIVLATHKVYESLTSNTNKYPPSYIGGTTPDWLDLGATNAWKMFDQSYLNQSVSSSSPLTIVLEPGQIINTLAILNISGATHLEITGVVGAETKYYKNIDLYIGDIGDWYEYFFSPIELKKDVVFTDIPPYPSLELTIELTGSTPSIGILMPGFYTQLGQTLWGVQSSILDYSRKEVDEFGNFIILQRKYSKTISADIFLDNSRVGYVSNLLADYRTTPALWIGNEDYESTIAYGYYRDFSVVLQGPGGSNCSLEIEGLT